MFAKRESHPAWKFLLYSKHDDLEYVRTEGSAKSDNLAQIDPVHVEYDESESEARVEFRDSSQQIWSVYRPNEIHRAAQNDSLIDPKPTEDELRLLLLYKLIRSEKTKIVVTCRDSLLKNRRAIEWSLADDDNEIIIMEPQEAAEIAGIFLRTNQEFVFYPSESPPSSFVYDLSSWNWRLSRILIPYHEHGEYLSSAIDRFEALFVGIDLLGEQYFSGDGNHIDTLVRYYFNNCISLLTGICDVLALYARREYDIDVSERSAALRTGNKLVKELRNQNKDVWNHFQSNHQFIELINAVRNDIIHSSGVVNRGPGGIHIQEKTKSEWRSHTMEIDNLSGKKMSEFKKYHGQFDDSLFKYDPMSEWGLIMPERYEPEVRKHTHIDTYQFLKKSVKEMAEFTSEYLRLMGCENRYDNTPSEGIISKSDLERVERYGLFPLLKPF